MLAIGDCLQNRYRVVRQLGHGGMGTVYEAHDERFENSVALKEVLIDLAKIADPVQQQMVARAFEREAKTLALLHHEAFPHVIDYFSERDHQYLIMELIRGEDLGEQLQARKKPFDYEDVLEWTKQLLDALDYLHTQEQPIIHRDLKPQNMKITARGKVKVLDFGIAKGADNKSSSTITNQTFVAATLNYSPIEQLLRVLDPTFRDFISQRHKEKVEDILEHTADARSDLYSLGATLYQLLTATQPHDTLKRALDIWAGKPDPLPNPMELNPKIPPYFNSILLKAMEIDRDSRFVSAAEMQQAIKRQLDAQNQSQNQAAWLAEHERTQNAAPEIGMQTQLRIAEEQKFLADLASPSPAKTEVLPPAGNISTPPPDFDPMQTVKIPREFIPPANQEEERRRIAEQQKFLAELDGPSVTEVGKNARPAQQESPLTDYGQVLPRQGQDIGQTNYGQADQQQQQPSADQTQVSYLANVLPPPAPAGAAAAAAADSTVINPQIRLDAQQQEHQFVPAAAAADESAGGNKLLWLIPVAGVGILLVVSIVGFLAYKFMAGGGSPAATPTPVKTPYTASETTPTPQPTAAATPATTNDLPATTQANNMTVSPSPVPSRTTAASKSAPEPEPTRAARAERPENTPRPAAQPQPTREATVKQTPRPQPSKTEKVRPCALIGEC